MFTPTTRPRGDSNLTSRLGRTDESVSLLGRRITQQKRPRPPAPATSAPIAGISHWYSGACVIFHPGGVAYYVTGGPGATLGDYSSEVGAPGPVSGIVNEEPDWEGYFKLSEAGLYSFRVLTRIALSKASAVPLVVRLSLERDAVYNDHEKLIHTIDGAATGVPNGTVETAEQALWEDWTIGTQWVQADERFHPRLSMNLNSAPAIGPNGASFTVEVTRYGDSGELT